jgi:hypothetical protein
VQSLDPLVLKNIQRDNISADGLMELALQASEVGANSYSEIILGLPGDTREKHYYTVRTIMDAGFTNIYLFQLMLLPGTDMCTDACKAEYGMVSRYRVLPRCYGHFDVLGERIVAAEIEEICVASNTLPFEHYLECRQMHLVVTIFHNDGVFGALLKFLRSLGISVYRWMELMRDAEKPRPLAALFEAFDRATRDELWEDRASLEAFVQEPGNVERFIAGELGNNLLFVHKTLAITQHASELADLARSTVRALLAEVGKDTSENFAFVDDALAYHLCRMSHLFHEMDSHVATTLRYDLPAYDEERTPEPIDRYELASPATYHFVLDESQRALIARYVNIYGASPVGLGRILSKVYVRKLFRHPSKQADAVLQGESEFRFRIAGLQN